MNRHEIIDETNDIHIIFFKCYYYLFIKKKKLYDC